MTTISAYDSPNFDLAEAWLSACESVGRRPRTVALYRIHVGLLRAWRTADPDLATLTKLEARAFTKRLLEHHSPGGAALIVRSLKAFYSWLVLEEEITASPFKGVSIHVPERPMLTATDEQVAAMLARAKSNPRDYLMLMIMTTTGCRKDEVSSLDFHDIDLRNRLITIRTSKTTPRIVPMTDATAVAFTRWGRRRGTARGSLWSTSAPYSLTERTVRKYSQRALGSHSLRRWFATTWLSRGGTESGLMRVCGWANADMVRRYVRANGDTLARDEHKRLFG